MGWTNDVEDIHDEEEDDDDDDSMRIMMMTIKRLKIVMILC